MPGGSIHHSVETSRLGRFSHIWHASVMDRPPLPCLLISTPSLIDPNFERTVILLVEWSADGALGVVLNRPTEMAIVDYLPEWEAVLAPPGVIHIGGPVEPDVAIGLAITAGAAPTLVDLADQTCVSGQVRVFSGYTGWGPRQLEHELAEGAWHLARWKPDDLVPGQRRELWRQVLRRQPGTMAFESTFPDDLSAN